MRKNCSQPKPESYFFRLAARRTATFHIYSFRHKCVHELIKAMAFLWLCTSTYATPYFGGPNRAVPEPSMQRAHNCCDAGIGIESIDCNHITIGTCASGNGSNRSCRRVETESAGFSAFQLFSSPSFRPFTVAETE